MGVVDCDRGVHLQYYGGKIEKVTGLNVTLRRYTRVTGKAVREALVQEKGYKLEDLPAEEYDANVAQQDGLRKANHIAFSIQNPF